MTWWRGREKFFYDFHLSRVDMSAAIVLLGPSWVFFSDDLFFIIIFSHGGRKIRISPLESVWVRIPLSASFVIDRSVGVRWPVDKLIANKRVSYRFFPFSHLEIIISHTVLHPQFEFFSIARPMRTWHKVQKSETGKHGSNRICLWTKK